LRADALLISIAAGVTLAQLRSWLACRSPWPGSCRIRRPWSTVVSVQSASTRPVKNCKLGP
jgi:hypothetical protein